MLKVINLFAGPGAGKSTTAAGLFHKMKLSSYNVELVTEYAKDLTWEDRHNLLQEEVYVFAKQLRRLTRLENKVEWVVTDSPIILSTVYLQDNYPPSFRKMVFEFWERFENHSFFVERVKEYKKVGRNQTEEEAKELDSIIKNVLDVNGIKHHKIPGNDLAPINIMSLIPKP